MSAIKFIKAKEIIDSLGYPTLRGWIGLENGIVVDLEIPSSIFIESNEPIPLRDGGDRLLGYGMKKAEKIINLGVNEKLKGVSVLKQKEIDLWLQKADSSKRKEILGVSTLLLVSLLIAKAAAVLQGKPLFKYLNELYAKYFDDIKMESLPSPIITLINGGRFSNNALDFKEFYVLFSSNYTFSQSLEKGVEVYHGLKETLEYRNISTSIAQQGGFSPNLNSNLDALDFIVETISKRGLKLGVDIFIGFDIGASDFYNAGNYKLSAEPEAKSGEDFYKYLSRIIQEFNVLYVEDPFSYQDKKNLKKFYDEYSRYQYIASDYLNDYSLDGMKSVVSDKLANTFIIKLTRYSSLLEIFSVVEFCRKNNLSYVFNQEISETNQDFIADLSVALQSPFVKFGAPVRGERVIKYNRIAFLESEYFSKAQ